MMGAVVWLSCVVVLTAASAVISDYFDGETGSYVGCLISNGLCQEDEVCLDDGVFGMCQSHMPTKNYYRHHLNSEQTEELEGIVYQLVEHGYTWRHRYTQCMLGNILVSYREDVQFNPRYCERRTNKDERGGWDSEDYLPDGSPVLVKKLSDEYADLSTGGDYPVYDDYNPEMEVEKKEDELIENLGQDRELKQFIDNLSTDELKVLKKFLVNEKASHQVERRHPFSLESTPEKKAPVTITKVVVHYNPPNEDEKSNKNFDYNFDKEPSKSLSEENKLLSVTSIDEEKHEEYESEQPNGGFKDEKIGKTLEKSTVKAVQPIVIKTSTTARPLSKFNMFVTSLSPSGFKEAQRLEPIEQTQPRMVRNREKYWITMYVLCGTVAVIAMSAIFVYFARRQARFREKIAKWASSGKEQDNSTNEYQDLCRQHMQAKLTEKPEPLHKPSRAEAIATAEQTARTLSTGSSSTSSWTEEPVKPNMDISTGHIILSYMEDHMQNKDRLQKEWDSLCAYDAEPCSIVAAIEPTNMRKNRYTDILPYEHSRVKLNAANNVSGSDYINASTITDHDPRNPAYIATQGPLSHTVADFWQMVWEQGSVVMVDLTRLMENSVSMCHRYWPEEGTDLYHIYEVHLVSEHALCDDYVVRSFFLKNLQINETRTVTQFHFLTWPNNGIPNSIKTLLDFRRKVNKSYRGRSVPVIVHCSDGAGRTGTYCLIDMALNRLSKGAKEIDIAATLEHMRDQRFNMVRTKEQFEFALAAVAEEVHAIMNVPNPQP